MLDFLETVLAWNAIYSNNGDAIIWTDMRWNVIWAIINLFAKLKFIR